jgi:hypothetical protein
VQADVGVAQLRLPTVAGDERTARDGVDAGHHFTQRGERPAEENQKRIMLVGVPSLLLTISCQQKIVFGMKVTGIGSMNSHQTRRIWVNK